MTRKGNNKTMNENGTQDNDCTDTGNTKYYKKKQMAPQIKKKKGRKEKKRKKKKTASEVVLSQPLFVSL